MTDARCVNRFRAERTTLWLVLAAGTVVAGCQPQPQPTTPAPSRPQVARTPPERPTTPLPRDTAYLPPACKRRPGSGLGGLTPITWPVAKGHLRHLRLERDLRMVKTT